MKHLQETETNPVAYATTSRITMTWMTENLHQQTAPWFYLHCIAKLFISSRYEPLLLFERVMAVSSKYFCGSTVSGEKCEQEAA